MRLSAREIQYDDIPMITSYWMNATDEHLIGMGADPKKMFKAEAFRTMLEVQITSDYQNKKALATIWTIDEKAVGHCNVNDITYGEQAYMHLHLWNLDNRKKGNGTKFILLSAAIFYDKLALKRIYSQPYAKNPAPNKTLLKAGFEFTRTFETTPGSINFLQDVNEYLLTKERFTSLTN